jgi:hypothetical protein
MLNDFFNKYAVARQIQAYPHPFPREQKRYFAASFLVAADISYYGYYSFQKFAMQKFCYPHDHDYRNNDKLYNLENTSSRHSDGGSTAVAEASGEARRVA